MSVVGHGQVVAHLRSDTPQVSLLLGPPSVGKTTAAEEVLGDLGVHDPLLLRYASVRVSDARAMTQFTSRRSRKPKGILAQLDQVTPEAANAMLKLLEEPPPATYFMLCASHQPLLTIASRAQVYRFGYLTDAEVAQVLQTTKPRLARDKAEKAARSSGGQVSRAREMARLEESKGPVLSALHAVAERNEDLFVNAVGGRREIEIDGQPTRVDAFGEVQWSLMRTWAREALTGRWRTFTPAESYGLQRDRRVADRVLRMADVARPKVAVRCALLPFILDRSRRA
jgi:DNA polymerase III, delta subunit